MAVNNTQARRKYVEFQGQVITMRTEVAVLAVSPALTLESGRGAQTPCL